MLGSARGSLEENSVWEMGWGVGMQLGPWFPEDLPFLQAWETQGDHLDSLPLSTAFLSHLNLVSRPLMPRSASCPKRWCVCVCVQKEEKLLVQSRHTVGVQRRLQSVPA